MRVCFFRDGTRRQQVSWLAVAALLAAFELVDPARSDALSPQGERAAASQPACTPALIPLQRETTVPIGLSLRGQADVSHRRTDALVPDRPELFHFQRYNALTLAGILSNGCAFEFSWTGKPWAYVIEGVRVLGPVQSLDRYYTYLRLPAPPPPTSTPRFEGYRHVMSTSLYPQGGSYIGLWRRTDGTPGSLVAMHAGGETAGRTLGIADWAYDGVYPVQGSHQFGFTLVDEPDGAGPLYLSTYDLAQPNPFLRHRRHN